MTPNLRSPYIRSAVDDLLEKVQKEPTPSLRKKLWQNASDELRDWIIREADRRQRAVKAITPDMLAILGSKG